MTEETAEEKKQRILAEKTEVASSSSAYIKAGALSGAELERTSEHHPAFFYPLGWGDQIGLGQQRV